MATEAVGWILNLDAEDELSHPGAHTPTRASLDRIAQLIPRLRSTLLGPDDRVLWPPVPELTGAPHHQNDVGRIAAWMPTRFAQQQARRLGLSLEGPPMEVLRAVNHRKFCAALGQHLPDAAFVTTRDEALAVLGRDVERRWLLKRPWGYAGRGRKIWRAADVEVPWLDAGLAEGGLQIEPLVERTDDWSLHGTLERDGTVTFATPVRQQVDRFGAWLGSMPDPDLPWKRELAQIGHTVAQALWRAGYWGPFGVDAYEWVDAGVRRFQPLSEINARFTMGMRR